MSTALPSIPIARILGLAWQNGQTNAIGFGAGFLPWGPVGRLPLRVCLVQPLIFGQIGLVVIPLRRMASCRH